MFFPTANITVDPWFPPFVALVISFFTSMGGVSGAFLLLPFQMSFLGYTHPSVSATNQVFNIVAIPSGVYRYWKEGRMVWPLTLLVIIGTLPGVFIGAFVRVVYLPDARNFKLFAAFVLLYIGIKMVRDLFKSKNKNNSETRFLDLVRSHREKTSHSSDPLPTVTDVHLSFMRLSYRFYGEQSHVSMPGIFSLSFIVGIVGGIYGIGGGSIIAPFFVTVFGLPVYTVAGAALMGTFVTSVAGVFFYQVLALGYPGMSVAPDWTLGLLFGLGGMIGMYLGARCQKFVPAKVIKWILAVIILSTALKYMTEFFK